MLCNNLLFTLLTVITLKSCHALPSQKYPIAYNLHQDLSPRDVNELSKDQRTKAALDVQTTIDEVQKLLTLDPSLPRLTKGEIKDLFEKVTKDELEQSILNGDEQKQNHMRYLIQALPFHSDEIKALEELEKKTATTEAPHMKPEVPDDLKELLKNYGLLDVNGKPIELAPLPISHNADSPSSLLEHNENESQPLSFEELQEEVRKASLVKAKDYEAFKPIENSKKNVTSDMESFLKQFGLVDSEDETRKRKSLKSSKLSTNSNAPVIDSSYLIPGYSSLLDNIGITTIKDKSGKKINLKPAANVFKSNVKDKGAEDDYKKLEQLLETIRELERLNASLTEKEVERLNLNNFNFSESLLSEGPDPLQYHIQHSALKNEVKRQSDEPTRVSLALTGPLLESSLEATDDSKDDVPVEKVEEKPKKAKVSPTTTTSKPTTTEAPEPSSTTTEESPSSVTEERKNSLEDEIEPIEDPEPLPPPRRSGFYMLLDWNSFLEVGEDPDKIVVRFDPKIGDPSRFIPINAPSNL